MPIRTPSSRQFKKVIRNFDKVLPFADFDGHMKMRRTDIDHSCRTPMCHGGWYASASKYALDDYTEGADLIAKDLGFRDKDQLEQWAQINYKLWGNKGGIYMFCNLHAFVEGNKSNPNVTLKDIRNWWAGVHNRSCPNKEPVECV
ncbi:MAG: hypothetical protein AAF542_19970 [Pseudomonadota bacterium]